MKKKILVIRFGSLGDVILTSATVLNLKLSYPESHLTYFTKEQFGPLVSTFDGVDEVRTLPANAGPGKFFDLLMKTDKENFNLVVDLHGNMRSWLARKIISADQAVVYPKRRIERQKIIRRKNKQIPQKWPHTIDLYNDCLNEIGARTYCSRPILTPSENSATADNTGTDNSRTVFIAPGAAHPNKQWGIDNFLLVAATLASEHSCHILWAVTSQDKPSDEHKKTLDRIGARILIDSPLTELAGKIAACDVTVANDSGLMHVSSAVGTPVVSVFGPTHQSLGFAPGGQFDQIVEVDEPCRPCSLHGKKPCYREERFCFSRISTEQVVGSVEGLLKKKGLEEPALFVDRDGTLIVDKHYLADPDKVELIPGAAEAVKKASEAGYRIVVLTNQSGVARGYFDIETTEAVNARVMELLSASGVEIDGLYYCPFYKGGTVKKYSIDSPLRKPRPGMVEQAAEDLGIDTRQSVVIGDKIDDINLGRVIGAKSLLVKTGHGKEEAAKLVSRSNSNKNIIFDNLLDAVNSIVR